MFVGRQGSSSSLIGSVEANTMEVMLSGSRSKLEQLLTAGITRKARRESVETQAPAPATAPPQPFNNIPNESATSSSSSATVAGTQTKESGKEGGTAAGGTDGTTTTSVGGDDASGPSTSTDSDKYRNPRKRLLMSSLASPAADQAPTNAQNESENPKKIMKLKSDISSRKNDTSSTKNGPLALDPASLKVTEAAPIRVKKYYPSAVQSVESEEFLVSVAEDTNHNPSSPDNKGRTSENSSSPKGAQLEEKLKTKEGAFLEGYPGVIDTDQIEKLLNMPSPPKNNWKSRTSVRRRKYQCEKCPKSYGTEADLKSHSQSAHSVGEEQKAFGCSVCEKRFKWVASLSVHMKKFHNQKPDKNGVESDSEESDNEIDDQQKESESGSGKGKGKKGESKSKVESNKEKKEMKKLSRKSSVEALSANKAIGSSSLTGISSDGQNNKQVKRSSRMNAVTEKTKRELLEANNKRVKSGNSKTAVQVEDKPKKASTPISTKTKVKELEEGTPPTSTRSSLRRNIQRPKWLTDTDLVTDYEFPRGTNPNRGTGTSSPAYSSTSSMAATVTSVTTGKGSKGEGRINSAITTTPVVEPAKEPITRVKPPKVKSLKTEDKEEGTKSRNARLLEKSKKIVRKKDESKTGSHSKKAGPVKLQNRSDPDFDDAIKLVLNPPVGFEKEEYEDSSPTAKVRKQMLNLAIGLKEGNNNLDNDLYDELNDDTAASRRRDRSDSLSMRSCGSGSQSEKLKALEDNHVVESTKEMELPELDQAMTSANDDTDLVTDYEFPRGTNPNRGTGTSSPASSATSSMMAATVTSVTAGKGKKEEGRINSTITTTPVAEFAKEPGTGVTPPKVKSLKTEDKEEGTKSRNARLLEKSKEIERKKDESETGSHSKKAGPVKLQNRSDPDFNNAIKSVLNPPVGFEKEEDEDSSPTKKVRKQMLNLAIGLKEGNNNLDNDLYDELNDDNAASRRRDRSDSLSMRSCGSGSQSEKLESLKDNHVVESTKEIELPELDRAMTSAMNDDDDDDSNESLLSEFSELAAQVSENTDAAKFKEDCLRFISTKVSANSMWAIRKELKKLKRDKKYFRFGKLSPLAAGLMHDIFCQKLP